MSVMCSLMIRDEKGKILKSFPMTPLALRVVETSMERFLKEDKRDQPEPPKEVERHWIEIEATRQVFTRTLNLLHMLDKLDEAMKD